MRRFVSALFAAIVVFWIARAVGIPAWRNWVLGDASDCALLTFWAVFYAVGSARKLEP